MNDRPGDNSIRIPDGDLFGLINTRNADLQNSARDTSRYIPERNYAPEPCPVYKGIVLN
jgi:hypothetical protein